MTHCLLSLTVQRKCDVPESTSRAHYSRVRFCVDSDIVESSQVNNQMAVLPTQPVRAIAVASTFGSHLDTVLDTTDNRILYMLDRLWYSICCRRERYPKVERFDGLCAVGRTSGEDRYFCST